MSQIVITMSATTVEALLSSSSTLYGFKAIRTQAGGGAPLVWFRTTDYGTTTVVEWTQQYQAYTSADINRTSNAQIAADFVTGIALGETLDVGEDGTGTVVSGGTEGAISFLNQSQTQFSCGSHELEIVSGQKGPVCTLPLWSNWGAVLAPLDKVLLMFSTTALSGGTVVYQAFAAGLFVDLTSASQRSVSFDINKGWSWGSGSWAQPIPRNSNLVPLLIDDWG